MKLIEKFMYYSVGFASETGDKLTKMMQKLIEKGEISQEEGKNYLDEYAQKAGEMTKKFDKKFEEFIEKTLESFSFVKAEECKKIEERIKKLEDSFL